ncbi:hypothetical protein Nepgr_016620 [Nepenthes gracilis]|uniref:Uncharacterized protein n=1 Tax=Nepenthes gracilis TaxID=150966 RepID=A0AAD3SQ17_NEPGR|nr:hypothetical protein Nepgr_016620 [Nepenthes gracilis]
MANPGVGNKFVSVNLNKSYGQSSQPNPSNRAHGSGLSRVGGYGGGGGGMVVLSRPRSSHKTGPRLSVPPPLNLPSLRKEHERSDSAGSGGGLVGGGLGSRMRPTSSGTGWSRPNGVASGEKNEAGADHPLSSDSLGHGLKTVEGSAKESTSAYLPPYARLGAAGPDVSALVQAEKAIVLRGEDFPSLRATLAVANAPLQKQKDALHQKQRQEMSEESSGVQRDGSHLSSEIDMRPKLQPFQHYIGNGFGQNGVDSHALGNPSPLKRVLKQEDYFPGPLPLVRLNPRSDWADDERDTGHGLTNRARDNAFSTTEEFGDRDFDFPRNRILPHKRAQNLNDRWGHRDDDIGKGLSTEVPKADPQNRNVRMPTIGGHEGKSWRSSISREGFNTQEFANDGNGMATRTTMNQETSKDRCVASHFGGNAWDENNSEISAGREFGFGRDAGYGQGSRQQRSNSGGSFNGRVTGWNMQDQNGNNSRRYKVDTVQNVLVSKSLFSSTSKGLPINDPLLNFGREKRSFSSGEKPYVEDPFSKEWESTAFDGWDPLSGGILGVVKRKKDVNKQVDFHDPVRESFEAELERVQKMQEQERQRIIEEQERALEIARREEEQRQRLAKEQVERQRQLEEEAHEAALRAEQERLEAIQRAEEQRIAREEEKKRILKEEERRKQAAKQKLLELEERIARRQAEAAKADSSVDLADEKMPVVAKERDVPREEDLGGQEDSERIKESFSNSVSSDSFGLNRSSDVSRAHSGRDCSFAPTERGKPLNSWRHNVFENGNDSSFFSLVQENGRQRPSQDASIAGRSFPRTVVPGGAGFAPYRGYYRGGMPEPLQMDDFSHAKGHRISGDGDPYCRSTELYSELQENVAENFGDLGWGHGHPRQDFDSSYPEQFYQNPEQDNLYPFGRSRYSARQPRVLPPPSFASMHRTPFRSESEGAGPSTYEDSTMHHDEAVRCEPADPMYDYGHAERQEHSDVLNVREVCSETEEQKLNNSGTPGCDSQSSLSVSSPPISPTHLWHDDMDESGDSVVVAAPTEMNEVSLAGHESFILNSKVEKENKLTASSSISLGDDEEWTVENDEELQEQEEYDEDEDGYHEEDEVHEEDDVHGEHEDVDLTEEFKVMNLNGKDSSHMMDNLVLGFDQGVEVGMPSDEYERSPRNEKNTYVVPQISVGIVREQESFDGRPVGHGPKFADGSPVVVGNSSTTIEETEKEMENMVILPIKAPHTTESSDILDSGNSSGAVLLAQQSVVPSSVDMNSHLSGKVVISSAAAEQSQPELPVKLQFGLFSGPSLIPSPVPAIQIGSIQMPFQLHPQVGPSLTHMHPLQPPLFQFGQIRYPSLISQGILPMAPQSMSSVQPNVPTHYSIDQKLRGHLSTQHGQRSSAQDFRNDCVLAPSVNHNYLHPSKQSSSWDVSSKEANLVLGEKSIESNSLLHKNRAEVSTTFENQAGYASDDQAEDEGHHQYDTVGSNVSGSHIRVSVDQLQIERSTESISGVKDVSRRKAGGHVHGNKGRKFAFIAKNPGQKSFLSLEASHSDSKGFQRRSRHCAQRMEFRVRQNVDRRQSSALVSSNHTVLDGTSIYNGNGTGLPGGGLRKERVLDRAKETGEEIPSSDLVKPQETDTEVKASKGAGKEAFTRGRDISHRREGTLKRNMSSEDAPLLSGVVCIYEQPGIEAPSDEDDFIEVRSKRQVLNDRREQREKENKAKSSNLKKASQRPHSVAHRRVVVRSTINASASSGEAPNGMHAGYIQKHGMVNSEVSAGFNNVTSQLVGPIGTPSVNPDAQADAKSQTTKSLQSFSLPVISSGRQAAAPGLSFETKSKVVDNAQTSLVSWGNLQINQQVTPLTQSQFGEIMKPVRFDTPTTSVGDINSVSELSIPSSSMLAKDLPFSSATSPIDSLLAGEKIQFGAVTSPTILPPSSCAVSIGIGPPGPSCSVLQVPQNMSISENDHVLLFEKAKHSSVSCVHLEDCEAAASAVVVAAIGNDEVVVNGLDSSSVSISDSKSFGHADTDNTQANGVADDQQAAASQSKDEGALTVSLPVDLSVDTPTSLWQHLPSPHSSSSQMLPPFPGGAPSHYPFCDINPILGGPIFAFGPHDDHVNTQMQLHESRASGSSLLGSWQQCHSGVDSFYGPSAGFTRPFINPSGGIPGVQGPHMVVYNHFAPVGQFGQVGLNCMGPTYIPSGKPPDWKHNPTSTTMGGEEGDMKNLNMVSVQSNPTSIPPVQHLAPGSPLLSVATPLAMFDATPFQSSPDMSIQGRWTCIPASSLHSIPRSVPLQQQAEGAMRPPFNHGSVDSQSLAANRFPMSQTASNETGRTFVIAAAATNAAPQFPDELGLVEPPSSAALVAPPHDAVSKGLPGSTTTDAASSNKSVPASKAEASQQKHSSPRQYTRPSNYNYQRGGYQKNGSGTELSSHKTGGFHGRNQHRPSAGDRWFPPTKVKQIYVAKPSSSGT